MLGNVSTVYSQKGAAFCIGLYYMIPASENLNTKWEQ